MKIENTEVYGFRAALRGMRNPMNSWDQSDSEFGNHMKWGSNPSEGYPPAPWVKGIEVPENPYIGPKDMALACKLIRAGTDHRKFLRQIQIWVDLTIPRYAWQELDTYKVATVRNSCSTMHKLGSSDLTRDDFEEGVVMESTLAQLNALGAFYREKKPYPDRVPGGEFNKLEGYDLVRAMKAILPESFLQRATYTMSYETALSMYFARRNHRLRVWSEEPRGDYTCNSITRWIKALPYMSNFIAACTK